MDQEFENLLIKRVLNTLELLEMYVELKEVLLGIFIRCFKSPCYCLNIKTSSN